MDLREVPADGGGKRHPWQRARRTFLLETLRDKPRIGRWLDAGSGDGWLANDIRARLGSDAQLDCWDINYSDEYIAAAEWADQDVVRAVRDPERAPYDLITAFDVLEHVEDDHAMVARFRQLLAPGGWLVMTVPAWPILFSQHDQALLHHRRYRPRQARRVLEGAGFRIVRDGGLFHSLLAARLLQLGVERLRGGDEVPEASLAWKSTALDPLIDGALRLDNAISARLGQRGVLVPGLSYWAVCVHGDSPAHGAVDDAAAP